VRHSADVRKPGRDPRPVHAIRGREAARRCVPVYQALVRAMPVQKAVTPDETGWRIGGLLAWLHVFVARRITVCAIVRKRGVEVAASILGWDYAGALIHDGWAPYDGFWRAIHHWRTCCGVAGR